MEPAREFGSPAALLDEWARFTELLDSDESAALISTPDAVDALLARSTIERARSGGADIDMVRLDEADRRYRSVAPSLMARTRVALYAPDESTDHWWWHVEPHGGPTSDLVDVATAARDKEIHPHTVRAAIRRRELPARRFGRSFLMLRRDVESWSPRAVGRPAAGGATDHLLSNYLDAVIDEDDTRVNELERELEAEGMTAPRAAAIATRRFSEEKYGDVLEWVGRARGIGVKGGVAGAVGVTRALALQRLGRGPEAVKELARVVDAMPDDPMVLGKFAQILWMNDRREQAEAVLSSGLARLSEPGELRLVRATLRFESDRTLEAYEDVLLFRAQDAEHRWAKMLLASILGRLGDLTREASAYEKAIPLFEEVLEPFGDVARVRLGIAHARLGHWSEAYEVAAKIPSDPERQADVVRAALIGALHTRDLPQAVAAAKAAVRRFGPTPLAWAFLALNDVRRGKPEEALRRLNQDNRPYRLARPEVAAVATAAWIGAGQPESAISLLLTSLPKTDDPRKLHLLQARAALAAGRLEDLIVPLHNLAEGSDEVAWIAEIALGLATKLAETGYSLTKSSEDRPSISKLAEQASSPIPWPEGPDPDRGAMTAISKSHELRTPDASGRPWVGPALGGYVGQIRGWGEMRLIRE